METTKRLIPGVWSADQLTAVENGTDLWLTTCMANRPSYGLGESTAFNAARARCKRYDADWANNQAATVTLYAPTLSFAMEWLDHHYTGRPDTLQQITTTFEDLSWALDKETPKLTRYHFSFGNSSTGPIGFCAAVWAETPEEAAEMLRERVEGTERAIDEDDDIVDSNGDVKGVEYVNVYFGDEAAITAAGIDETEEA